MNDITAILHQLEEGRLSTEEAAEKIRADHLNIFFINSI